MEKDYSNKKLVEPVIIEEIENGKLDGKLAVQGRKVSIYYTGKLKGSGKLFNSILGEAPLRFRLGKDILDIAEYSLLLLFLPLYSEEGLMESVPKNAWLVYEVEAVKHFNKLNSPHCFKFVTGYCYVIGSGNLNKMESKLRGKGQRVHICTKSGQLVSIWVIEICIPHRHVTAQRRPSISA
ncbi:hypothetical protein F2Q70_00043784 [Brassica cretica]|uniref:peptidylprolyl isomerase n=1 Tax=Brassica cretica TaxID=69181 RepID=A0A8S9KCW1_BRACR|nr:hypothetical protein F2Q70_00043784 [Brassica cretica]